jgi:hypothetical protein
MCGAAGDRGKMPQRSNSIFIAPPPPVADQQQPRSDPGAEMPAVDNRNTLDKGKYHSAARYLVRSSRNTCYANQNFDTFQEVSKKIRSLLGKAKK